MEMKKRILSICILLGVLISLIGGCSKLQLFQGNLETVQTEDITAQEKEEYIVVGFSQIGSESLWRTANTASIQNALTKEKGYFLQFNNARQKQENQIKAIRSFISQRVDYIVFSPVTQDGWETVLQEAKEAHIPVILVDRMVSVKDSSLYTTWIGTNSKAEGIKAGAWLDDYLLNHGREDEDINIVVLQGTIGSSVQLGRRMGFDTIADLHDNWHILQQESADFTTSKGKEVMQMLLNKYPDIDVIVSQNDDMTFGALEALEEAGIKTGTDGEVIMISFDAVKGALELVQQGIINVDVECNPEQGRYVEEVIQKLERGEKVEKSYVVEEKVFTQNNVNNYIDERTY